MDIIKATSGQISNFLFGLPLNLKIFIVRLGLWSIFTFCALFFTWLKIRISLVQVLVAFIVTYFSFSVRLGFVGRIGKGAFAFFGGICLLCIALLPGKIAFLLTPRFEDQLRIKHVLYITIGVLFVVQLFFL
jgi:hypothetical protein